MASSLPVMRITRWSVGKCFVSHISDFFYFDPFAILEVRQIANDIYGLNK